MQAPFCYFHPEGFIDWISECTLKNQFSHSRRRSRFSFLYKLYRRTPLSFRSRDSKNFILTTSTVLIHSLPNCSFSQIIVNYKLTRKYIFFFSHIYSFCLVFLQLKTNRTITLPNSMSKTTMLHRLSITIIVRKIILCTMRKTIVNFVWYGINLNLITYLFLLLNKFP